MIFCFESKMKRGFRLAFRHILQHRNNSVRIMLLQLMPIILSSSATIIMKLTVSKYWMISPARHYDGFNFKFLIYPL